MKSNIYYRFSTKTAWAMMLATAVAIYTANVNAADPAVTQQLSDARTKAAQLEILLAQNAPRPTATPAAVAPPMPNMSASASPAPPMPSMSPPGTMKPSAMGDDKMMGMMKMMPMMEKMMPMMEKMMPMMEKMTGAMSAMAPAAPMTSMGDDKMEMAAMMGMSPMGNDAAAAMSDSALPGFPGASHLYHIGATGFFLDHPKHITLSADQQVALNKIKSQALLAKSAADRAMEQAEQELGTLTAADQPEIAKIESKVRDIAKMAGDQRLAFIRAVGEAAKLLTADQRKILTGFAPPAPAVVAPAMQMPAPAASATPMPMKDM